MLAGRPSSKLDQGRTDQRVAEAVGMRKDTYRKAKEIVESVGAVRVNAECREEPAEYFTIEVQCREEPCEDVTIEVGCTEEGGKSCDCGESELL